MSNKQTADHYSKQWGQDLNFGQFIKDNPDAAKVMPARQLPWQDLFDRIRAEAEHREVSVYDAACGFGDIMRALTAEPNSDRMQYLGADIQHGVTAIERPANAKMVLHDITEPLDKTFDYIVCRAAIHHTPAPEKTFKTLVGMLNAGGTIAITAYAKKAPMREAIDDALRAEIVPMGNDEAFATANQLTALGRDLQASAGTIVISQDLPFLGVKAGTYSVQAFIYNHFIKCWHNPAFSEEHCDLVNFDWYHPPYAFRYTIEELREWAGRSGLKIVKEASTDAQHFMQCECLEAA